MRFKKLVQLGNKKYILKGEIPHPVLSICCCPRSFCCLEIYELLFCVYSIILVITVVLV